MTHQEQKDWIESMFHTTRLHVSQKFFTKEQAEAITRWDGKEETEKRLKKGNKLYY